MMNDVEYEKHIQEVYSHIRDTLFQLKRKDTSIIIKKRDFDRCTLLLNKFIKDDGNDITYIIDRDIPLSEDGKWGGIVILEFYRDQALI